MVSVLLFKFPVSNRRNISLGSVVCSVGFFNQCVQHLCKKNTFYLLSCIAVNGYSALRCTCLERTADDLFTCFNNNGIKANVGKCHLLLSTQEKLKANISNYTITNSNKDKLLRVTIDNPLKFESHVKNVYSKAGQKLCTLSRLSLYMSLNQRRMIMQSFNMSQFGYCPLIWMNYNRSLNNNNRIHERALRIVYRDKKPTFKELLEKDNSVTVHVKISIY